MICRVELLAMFALPRLAQNRVLPLFGLFCDSCVVFQDTLNGTGGRNSLEDFKAGFGILKR
jgi:hypothetical protein